MNKIDANRRSFFLRLWSDLSKFVESDKSLHLRLQSKLSKNRSIGSQDRQIYRELVYTTLRYLPWIQGTDLDRRSQVIAWLSQGKSINKSYRPNQLQNDFPYDVPDTLIEKAKILNEIIVPTRQFVYNPKDLIPSWFHSPFHSPLIFSSPHLDFINKRANIWIRMQCNQEDHREFVIREFRENQWITSDETTNPSVLPDAISLFPDTKIENSLSFKQGLVEIQDIGSQLVLKHANVKCGDIWLDACAGGGGKTVQLAHMVGKDGSVHAHDIRPLSLKEIEKRGKRANIKNIRIVSTQELIVDNRPLLYDGVLVDSPCSGSGTFRRFPHLKWYLKPDMITNYAKKQENILATYSSYVKPGGYLVYSTCSLSSVENNGVVSDFLQKNPKWKPVVHNSFDKTIFDGIGTQILPGGYNSDAFYVACLQAPN